MKKALVAIVAVCMMFAFSATTFAADFSDMDKATDVVKDAVNKSAALEIINGYPDGTFKPEATITRAEFAKIACVAAGLKSSGEVLGSTKSQFKDVATNQWYTGWVNLANSKGYLKGYEDGTFKPNQTISNQEVVTVLMRMLGYTDNLTGPWPIDYINQAAKLDIMEDISFVGAAASTRGDVAVMVDVTLDQRLVEYSKDIEDFQDKTPIKTLLNDSFKGGSAEDLTFDSLSVKDFDKQTFSQNNYCVEVADTAYTGSFNMFNIAGHQGNIIFSKDSKGVSHAKFIEVTSKKIKTTTEPTKVGSKIKFDGKEYTVQKDAVINLPGAAKNTYFYAYINEDGEIYNVTNDVKVPASQNAKIVKKVDEANSRVTFLENGNTVTLKDADTQFVKDGKYVKIADVKAGDVLVEKMTDVYTVEAGITGKLTQFTGTNSAVTSVTIDGVKYQTPNGFTLYDGDYTKISTIKDYINTDVKVAVNSDNLLYAGVATSEGETTTLYGVVTDFGTPSGAYESQDLSEVTVFNNEGKTVTYKVKSDVLNHDDSTASTIKDTKYVAVGQMIEYRLDADGAVKSATVVKATTTSLDTKKYLVDTSSPWPVKDNKYITVGNQYSVASKAPVFSVREKDNKVEVKLLTATDLLKGSQVKSNDVAVKQDKMTANIPAGLYATIDGTQITAVAVIGLDAVSDSQYGFIEDYDFYSVDYDNSVKLYGDDKVYKLDKNSNTAAVDSFVKYEISGDTLKLMSNDMKPLSTEKITEYNDDMILFDSAVGDGALTKTQWEVTKDTKVYVVDGSDITAGTASDILTGYQGYAAGNSDAEATVVVIYKNATSGGGNVTVQDVKYVTASTGITTDAVSVAQVYFADDSNTYTKAAGVVLTQNAPFIVTIVNNQITGATAITVPSNAAITVASANSKGFKAMVGGIAADYEYAANVAIYSAAKGGLSTTDIQPGTSVKFVTNAEGKVTVVEVQP